MQREFSHVPSEAFTFGEMRTSGRGGKVRGSQENRLRPATYK